MTVTMIKILPVIMICHRMDGKTHHYNHQVVPSDNDNILIGICHRMDAMVYVLWLMFVTLKLVKS